MIIRVGLVYAVWPQDGNCLQPVPDVIQTTQSTGPPTVPSGPLTRKLGRSQVFVRAPLEISLRSNRWTFMS